jgi:HlyD family secretion protein
MSRWVQRVVIVAIVLGVLGAGAAWYLQGRNGQVMAYRTAPVTRGDLLVSISATGTVEPEEVIDVGAQIAGQIMSFGKDPAKPSITAGPSKRERSCQDRRSPHAAMRPGRAAVQSAGRRCNGRN